MADGRDLRRHSESPGVLGITSALRRRLETGSPAPGSTKPHVCMVVHSRYPVTEPRGHREALAAIEAGYRVDVICMQSPDEPSLERVDGVGVHRLPVDHIRGVSTVRTFHEYLRFARLATVAVLKLH